MEAQTESFGTGRSRRERGPKGRALDDAALAEIRALLATDRAGAISSSNSFISSRIVGVS